MMESRENSDSLKKFQKTRSYILELLRNNNDRAVEENIEASLGNYLNNLKVDSKDDGPIKNSIIIQLILNYEALLKSQKMDLEKEELEKKYKTSLNLQKEELEKEYNGSILKLHDENKTSLELQKTKYESMLKSQSVSSLSLSIIFNELFKRIKCSILEIKYLKVYVTILIVSFIIRMTFTLEPTKQPPFNYGNDVVEIKSSDHNLWIRSDGVTLNSIGHSLEWERYKIKESQIYPNRYTIESNHFKNFLHYNIETDKFQFIKDLSTSSKCSTFKLHIEKVSPSSSSSSLSSPIYYKFETCGDTFIKNVLPNSIKTTKIKDDKGTSFKINKYVRK